MFKMSLNTLLVTGFLGLTILGCSPSGGGGGEASSSDGTVDTLAIPTVSFVINGGADYTNNANVTLTLTVTESPNRMYITNTAGCGSGGSWVAFNANPTRTLANLNASNTIYVKVRNSVSSISTCVSATIIHDNVAPTAASIAINGGAAFSNSLDVTLNLSATGNPVDMYVTNTAGCASGGSWEMFSTSKAWVLPNANASNTVYYKVRDAAANESACISDSITHDPNAPTININASAAYTNTTAVTLNLSAPSGITEMYATNTAGCASGGNWEAYSTTKAWTLTTLNATNTVYIKYRDAGLIETSCISDSIIHDNVAPSVTSININSGAASTVSDSVNIALAATGSPTEMYLTQDASCNVNGVWEPYATSKVWTLTAPNSNNTVYFKVRDVASNESSCISDSIVHDNLPPDPASMVFTDGSGYINNRNTTINMTVGGSPAQMYITNTAGCASGGTWQAFAASKAWTTTNGDGTKTVYGKFRDALNNETSCISASTILDTAAPTATSISINGGAASTNSLDVTLTLAGGGSPTEMYVTNTAGCASGGAWETYNTTRAWTLTTPSATNTVYFRVRDAALNQSTCISDTIVHDLNAPTLSINAAAAQTNSTAVTLTLNGSTGATEMYITNTAGCGSGGAWEAYSTSKAWNMTAGDGVKTVYGKYRDASLVESSCISDTITLDTVAPAATSISINAGAASTTSLNVTLTLAATGTPSQVYITQDASCTTGGTWQGWGTSKPWTLTTANATNTVYFKVRDAATNESTCLNDTIVHDNAGPTVNSFAINAGAAYTTSTAATLNISVTDANQMYITNTAGCGLGGTWEAYSTTKAWTLLNPNATNIVYAKFRDTNLNESTCTSASIVHDTIAPMVSSIVINNGDVFTNNVNTTLTVSASGGPTEMYVTQMADCASGGAWEAYSTTKAWTLTAPNTVNTVYFKVRDGAGNESSCYSDSIDHEQDPVLAFTIPATNFIQTANLNNFTIGGTCSPDGLTVVLSGAVSTSAPCTAGNWSKNLDFSLYADGDITIYADMTNNHNVPATQVSRTLVKDTVAPENPAFAVLGVKDIYGVLYVNTTNVNLSAWATGASEMYITNTALCLAGGVWEPYSSLPKAWTLGATNQTVSVYAKYRDGAGNETACVQANILHDNIGPSVFTVANTDPMYVNSVNQFSYVMSGACSDHLERVVYSGMFSIMSPCMTNAWSRTLNLSGFADGNYTLNFDYTDIHKNPAARITRNVIKDTELPTLVWTTATNAYVNPANMANFNLSGTCSENGQTVTLSNAANAVTTCNSGSWSVNVDFTGQPEGIIKVLAVHRDLAGNNSLNMWKQLIVDTVAPTIAITSPAAGSTITSSTVTNFAVSGTCSENATFVNITGDATAQVVCNSNVWSANLNFSSAAEGNVTIQVATTDRAGNTSSANRTFLKSAAIYPVVTITSPAQNSEFIDLDQKLSGKCDANYANIDLAYSAGVNGPATAPCSGGNYSFFFDISGSPGTRYIDVSQSSAPGVTTTVRYNFSYKTTLEVKGQILAMAKASDGSMYYGGDFTSYSTTKLGRAIRIDYGTGNRDLGFEIKSGFNGDVYAMVELGDGSLVFGGSFSKYRGRIANKIAKISSSGELDLTFNPQTGANGANLTVRSLAVSGSSIYVGGSFTTMKGLVANRIAKINFSGDVDTTFNPQSGENGANSNVMAMLVSGTDLFIGGDFTTYRGATANRLVKIDRINGSVISSFAADANKTVSALLINGSSLYVGGSFSLFNSSVANAIAKVDPVFGTLDTTFNPNAGDNGFTSYLPAVRGLAAFGTDIIAVGSFTSYRSSPANSIAKISSLGVLDTTFSPSTGLNGFNDQANAVVVIGGSDIYVVGNFSHYRGANARGVAKLDSDGLLDTVFNPNTGVASTGADGSVNTLIASASGVYLAGSFTSYRDSYIANRMLKLDSSGNIDFAFNPQSGQNGFNDVVRSIVVDGSNLFVGGDFTSYRGNPANRVAKLALNGVLNTTFNPSSGDNGVDKPVRSLVVSGSSLYIGGDFLKYRNANAVRVAKVDTTSGALDTVFNPATGANGVNNSVYAMGVSGSDLYVGGAFTLYQGQPASRIAKINASNGALDTTFNPSTGANGANSIVYSMAVSGSDIFIGGAFTSYRGTVINRLAKLDSSGNLAAGFSVGTGSNSLIHAMALGGGSLYIAGDVTAYNGGTANRVAKLDAATGTLDTTFSPATGANGIGGFNPHAPNLTPQVNSLFYDSGNISIGGLFTLYRNLPFNYLVKVDSSGNPL